MSSEVQFRKKLSEKEILSLKESEIEKIERVNEALAKGENAEGYKESQLKMRILFERTAAEMLPFVIYCLTFAPIATYSLFKIMDLKGTPEFYWGLGGLLVIMVLPLFVLPHIPFTKWFTKKE
jgi:predicted cobalt transporter CbtA